MSEIVMEPEVIEIPEPDISHLITEDNTPVDNIFSEKQQRLLTDPLYSSWSGPGGEKRSFMALANVGLFYSVEEQAIVPDILVSLDVQIPADVWEKKHRSYFIWEYGKPPEVVIEVVSNRKGGELGSKKERYARLGIAYYVVYDPNNQLGSKTLHLFERRGSMYAPLRRPWLSVLELGLTLWTGVYQEMEATWLRWTDEAGNVIPTGAERAEAAEARVAELEARLRQLEAGQE
jgi:Uma2 family endonuclease